VACLDAWKSAESAAADDDRVKPNPVRYGRVWSHDWPHGGTGELHAASGLLGESSRPASRLLSPLGTIHYHRVLLDAIPEPGTEWEELDAGDSRLVRERWWRNLHD
jgi:hypothetical protein